MLEQLLNLGKLLVGVVHLAVELGRAGTVWVGHQKALRFLHFGRLLGFHLTHGGGNVLTVAKHVGFSQTSNKPAPSAA